MCRLFCPNHIMASPAFFAPPAEQAAAARELTTLLDSHPAFSYIRLSDGEVQWMQLTAEGRQSPRYQYTDSDNPSIEYVRCVTGMEPHHLSRFLKALHDADYLDYCDSTPAVRAFLASNQVARRPNGWRNPSPAASNIIFAWTYMELGSYLQRHRCLFAGAEAALLEALWGDPEYRQCARTVLPKDATARFHQVRENGRHYSENLDLIKQDLIAALSATGADTLFLSLATGAKILCQELARERGIRAVDFGSMMRALSYAGSSGYQAHRGTHVPFFFHVPFLVHMRAVERAFAALPPAELAGKAYAQLAIELHPHVPFAFNTSDGIKGGGLDLSAENRRHFHAAQRDFRRKLWPRWRRNPEIRLLDRQFRHWLSKHGIGVQGFLLQQAVAAKRLLRKLLLIK